MFGRLVNLGNDIVDVDKGTSYMLKELTELRICNPLTVWSKNPITIYRSVSHFGNIKKWEALDELPERVSIVVNEWSRKLKEK